MRNFIGIFYICLLFVGQAFAESKPSAKNMPKIPHSVERGGENKLFSPAKRPIDYVRTQIILQRKSPPKLDMPWQENPASQNPNLTFDVEIRDGMSIYNKNGWYNLSSYEENSGVVMAFGEPTTQPVIRSTQYAPTDIMFIDKQGKITEIVPNLTLSDLEQDIHPSSPVVAFFFIKGGSCAKLSINVGDEVIYAPLFKKPPTIINAPPSPALSPTPLREREKEGSNGKESEKSAPVSPVKSSPVPGLDSVLNSASGPVLNNAAKPIELNKANK